MKSIKIYLLPFLFLLFSAGQVFSQSDFEKDNLKKERKFSKADSVIVETYLTEEDYNRLNEIRELNEPTDFNTHYGDEVYNEEPISQNRKRNVFWNSGTAELVVDVFVNTMFLIAAFWH
ncbi:MAG: hypothetical protein P8Q14_01710 [Vicingaceae bacterium]|nr:hypothetical protein [Vicingaceae bacterium]